MARPDDPVGKWPLQLIVLRIKRHHLLLPLLLIISCAGKDQPNTTKNSTTQSPVIQDANTQIADYIRNIFQDKHGHLWFGTNGYGVAHYNGDSIAYYSMPQGFHGHQITGITEDLDKNLWFSTDQGVVKYDWSLDTEGNKLFTNFSDEKHFEGLRCWSICADSKGQIWAGLARGISRYDGTDWKAFALPYPEEATGTFITKRTAWSIIEDSAGHMWFSTNGYGAYKYDGRSFTQYSKTDGLTDNDVDVIMEDSQGQIWFGTRYGGISRYNGNDFVNFTQHNSMLGNDEVCAIYEDKSGRIWFSSEGHGVYSYDPAADHSEGTTFSNYSTEQGLYVSAVQTIYEDREGRFWVGGGGGLYRLDMQALPVVALGFINVTKQGPWE